MSGDPYVSVLMTAYNREKYISTAIESVLNSSFRDFELIIVDDDSKDKTVEVARTYAEQDSRIRVHTNSTNIGDYPNRNRAASLARGKYLKYVDADDIIYPMGLEVLVSMMERYPEAGYGLCSLEQDVSHPYPFQLSGEEAYRRHYYEYSLFHKAPLSSIIRKSSFMKVGGFSGKRMVGDFEMWHLLSSQFPIVLMPQGIVWYRHHAEQEMKETVRDPAKYRCSYWSVTVDQMNSPYCPLPEKERRIVLNRLRRQANSALLRALIKGRFADAAMYTRWRQNLDFS